MNESVTCEYDNKDLIENLKIIIFFNSFCKSMFSTFLRVGQDSCALTLATGIEKCGVK